MLKTHYYIHIFLILFPLTSQAQDFVLSDSVTKITSAKVNYFLGVPSKTYSDILSILFVKNDNNIPTEDSIQTDKNPLGNWQLKFGYSINNKYVFIIEGSYLLPVSKLLYCFFDTRIYSFISFTPGFALQPIIITENISFSCKAGLGVVFIGPVAAINTFTFETGITLRYKISNGVHILIEYRQLDKSAIWSTLTTLPPVQTIKNFPIKILTFGIEL